MQIGNTGRVLALGALLGISAQALGESEDANTSVYEEKQRELVPLVVSTPEEIKKQIAQCIETSTDSDVLSTIEKCQRQVEKEVQKQSLPVLQEEKQETIDAKGAMRGLITLLGFSGILILLVWIEVFLDRNNLKQEKEKQTRLKKEKQTRLEKEKQTRLEKEKEKWLREYQPEKDKYLISGDALKTLEDKISRINQGPNMRVSRGTLWDALDQLRYFRELKYDEYDEYYYWLLEKVEQIIKFLPVYDRSTEVFNEYSKINEANDRRLFIGKHIEVFLPILKLLTNGSTEGFESESGGKYILLPPTLLEEYVPIIREVKIQYDEYIKLLKERNELIVFRNNYTELYNQFGKEEQK